MELLIYKLCSLGAGVFAIWLGYKLLMAGVFHGDDSEIEAVFGDARILMKRLSPGVSFAVFGALVIGLIVWKGFSFSEQLGMMSNQRGVAPPTLGNPPEPEKGDVVSRGMKGMNPEPEKGDVFSRRMKGMNPEPEKDKSEYGDVDSRRGPGRETRSRRPPPVA